MVGDYLILESKINNCVAEVHVNDVPVRKLAAPVTLDSRPVHQYLVPGQNRFRLVIQPGPNPGSALAPQKVAFVPDQPASAAMRLMSMPRGAFPDDPGVRVLFNQEWNAPAGQPVQVPHLFEHSQEVPGAGHNWEWIRGATFNTPASVQPVLDLLRACREGFARRDPGPFLEAAQARFRVMQIAYGLEIESEIAKFRASFEKVASESGFQMESIDDANADLRICGDGKLVDCVDRAWEPILRSAKQPNGLIRLRYSVKVVRINGALQITL
jgi:hypothetical protein